LAASARSKKRSRVPNIRFLREAGQLRWPRWIGAADQQGALEPPLLQSDSFQAILECALVQEQLRTNPDGTIAALGA
jgi:hypothetical protein